MMKKKVVIFLTALLSVSIMGCGTIDSSHSDTRDRKEKKKIEEEEEDFEYVQVKASPDKYTYYVKNYVGQNLANVGYTSLGGEKRDKYGNTTMLLSIVNEDGRYIDINDEDDMKDYVVVEQMPEVNTEIKITYETDSDGNEYDYLIDSVNFEEIVIMVDKVGTRPNKKPKLTEIPTKGDRYHLYIKDYVGRNLGNTGYISLGGELRDEYGDGNVKLNLITEDGSYIDLDDEKSLQNYVVVSQDVKPGTKIEFTYDKDRDGVEYSNLIDTISYEEINLYVKKLKKKK